MISNNVENGISFQYRLAFKEQVTRMSEVKSAL